MSPFAAWRVTGLAGKSTITERPALPPVADSKVVSSERKCMTLSPVRTHVSLERGDERELFWMCGRRGSAAPLLRRASEERENLEE